MPRKRAADSILNRLPETARPEFERLTPDEQRAAARRDADRFVALTRELHELARRARGPSLEERLRIVERIVTWLVLWVASDGPDRPARRRVGAARRA